MFLYTKLHFFDVNAEIRHELLNFEFLPGCEVFVFYLVTFLRKVRTNTTNALMETELSNAHD